MALTSWYAFKFFDTSQVYISDKDTSSLFSQGSISSICAGSENLFVGNQHGQLFILSKAFSVVRVFKAHDSGSITHLKQIKHTSLLVTVSEDLSYEPILKVWALDKLDKKTGIPKCQSTLLIQNGKKLFPISAFAAVDDLSQLAFGFANGSVTLVRGDLIHDRGTRQRIVFESEEPITGIQFREGNTTALYIATTARILTLVLAGRGQGQPARVLDDKGCAVGCMTVDQETRDVIVARDDAIYYYGLHGRGTVLSFDGQKTAVQVHKDYLAVVSPAGTNSISKSNLSGSTLAQDADVSKMSTMVLLNTDFRFIALVDTIPSQVKSLFTEWDEFFALTVDGKVFRYHEKSLQQKLEILFQRKLFIQAVQIAQKAGVDKAQQNVIFRKYGDHLYQEKDYDTAMQQYLRAIDNTEPSVIIRKFLDTQRIHNLIDYLKELHEHHKANTDHTTLLLNCYAKLKDVEKLQEFIKSPGELTFDLDTAISMCRQGGYYDQAAFLARKHSEHDVVISVLVEDSKKYAEALAYIWRLEPETAYRNMTKYGTVLLRHCPGDATQLFVDFYTGYFKPKKDAVVVTPVSTVTQGGGSNIAASAVQNLAALLPLPYMNVDVADQPTSQKTQTKVVEADTGEPGPEYDIPKPRTAFAVFVDHPSSFIAFLEALANSGTLKGDERADVYTTLFEMYLRASNEKSGDEQAQWKSKARNLIEENETPIKASDVLLLSDLERFRDGTILVKEQQGLRFDIFRSYTSAKDTTGAIEALRKYGPDEPQLYSAALAYFASDPKILKEAGDEFDAVLKKVDENRLMAPLQVVQTLSNSGVATMGLIKSYLQSIVSRERGEISNNRRITSTFRADTAAKKTELADLTGKPQTFTAMRCSSCGYALDMPTVHFMCKHSFHQRCLNIGEGESVETVECPLDAAQNATIRAIKKAQEENRDRYDMFKDDLARSRDGFSTVAEWFGRGVMTVPPTD